METAEREGKASILSSSSDILRSKDEDKGVKQADRKRTHLR